MMPVRQNPGAQLKNEKTPAASQRYDRNAVIWPQMWTPARQIASNRYDASSVKNMTPIKSVTLKLAARAPKIHRKNFVNASKIRRKTIVSKTSNER
jgi:hypothetical protein